MWRATSGAKRRPGVTKIRGGKRDLQKSYAKEPRCEPKNRHRRAWNKFLWSHIEYVPAEPPFPDFPVTTADAQTCAGCEIFPLSYCLVPAWYFKFVPATFAPYRGRYTPISSFKKARADDKRLRGARHTARARGAAGAATPHARWAMSSAPSARSTLPSGSAANARATSARCRRRARRAEQTRANAGGARPAPRAQRIFACTRARPQRCARVSVTLRARGAPGMRRGDPFDPREDGASACSLASRCALARRSIARWRSDVRRLELSSPMPVAHGSFSAPRRCSPAFLRDL